MVYTVHHFLFFKEVGLCILDQLLTSNILNKLLISNIPLWRRKQQPTPVFLPRESCGWRSLVGCCPQGRTELDSSEATQSACMHWRRKWQPTRVFLPRKSQGQRNLVGCHLWGCTELDMTEVSQQQQYTIKGNKQVGTV